VPLAVGPKLPRTVIVLGFVSLLNDAASEMITPLLPIFLTTTLGAGPAIVGLVEGVAEATASVLKLFAGRLADRGVGAKGLVLGGYGIANAVRPAIGLALGWPYVLVLRFLDRVGKGIRTAPREALIAGATDASIRGRAFGFHSAMDNLGATVGPLLAFALLAAKVPLGRVFLWSAIPGVLVIALLVAGIRRDAPLERHPPPVPLSFAGVDARLRALIGAAGVLALAAVPEVFVVLWARRAGLPLAAVPLVWAAANFAKTLIAYPAGTLSDRVGRLPLLLGGWGLRVLALAALAAIPADGVGVWVLFVAYSATLALTEPVERSLVGDVAPTALRGTLFGLYHLVSGVCVLPGAVLFGLVWERAGPGVAFAAAAAVTAAGAAGFALAARPRAAAAA
jgi:MFS family permease